MKSVKYLDMVKQKHGIKDDKDLAKALGMAQSAVSHYRTGKRVMDDEQCLKVAQMLGMENPLPIIAAAGMDRAEKTGQTSLWQHFTKATMTTTILAGVVALSPSPAEASQNIINNNSLHNITEQLLCALRKMAKKATFIFFGAIQTA